MKYLKYIAVAALATIGLTSCDDDFFDTASSSSVAVTDMTDTQIQQLVAGIYNNFSQDRCYRNRYYLLGYNTDIEWNSKTGTPAQLTQYNMTPTNSEVSTSNGKDVWGHLSRVCSDAASVIDIGEATLDKDKKDLLHYLGEAYFMRAYGTYEMLKIWGDIPIVESSTEVSPLKRDRNEAFDLILSDLDKAIAYLQWSQSSPTAFTKTISRASKQAAFALKARVALMYAGKALRPDTWIVGGGSTWSVQYNEKDATKRQKLYEIALACCDSVIEKDGASKLQSNFEDIFKGICSDELSYVKSEYIYVLPFADGTRGQFLNYHAVKSTDANGQLLHKGTGSNNATAMVTPTFVYDFEAGDARKWVTVAPFTWVCDNGSSVSSDATERTVIFPASDGTSNIVYQKKQDINKFYLGKFRYEWAARDISSSDDGIDIPIIRYADVLLMYAEAALGSVEGNAPSNADLTKAQACFDKIRTRAGLATKPLTMADLVKERAFEFCGENIRKYDLERWGYLTDYLKNTKARIANLDAHTGEFAATQDTIYFKYKQFDSYLASGATAMHAYVLDSVYGLAVGETGEPATYSKANGWVKKNFFEGETSGRYLPSYLLYSNDANLEREHYWPIFNVNISSSDGNLWNDYGY